MAPKPVPVTILISSAALAGIILVLHATHHGYQDNPVFSLPFYGFILFTVVCVFSYRTRPVLAAYSLLGSYFLTASQSIIDNGSDNPIGLFLYALVILLSGILIHPHFTVVTAILCSGTYFSLDRLGLGQNNQLETDEIATLILIGLVTAITSWVYSRDIERNLMRASQSEAALIEERDRLEERFQEKARELEQSQRDQLRRLHRFAEYGKIFSELLHDLANPLTTISLNLESASQIEQSAALRRALRSSRLMQEFIESARTQINEQPEPLFFSPNQELHKAVTLLKERAEAQQVRLSYRNDSANPQPVLWGNAARFNLVCVKLIADAIEASSSSPVPGKVTVRLYRTATHLVILVKDSGTQMAREDLSRMFNPLFSGRSGNKNLGLGLAIAKDIIELDFSGSIEVRGNSDQGASFILQMPVAKDF